MTPARPSVFVHIGPMKTGSTFLQRTLEANRDELAAAGVLLPSRRDQVRAVRDALRLDRADAELRQSARGAWQALASQLREHPGTSIVSQEFLSFAGPATARRIVRSIGAADVHVVLTLRDAQPVIPAKWQTGIHSGSTVAWPDYLAGVRKAETPIARLGRLAPDAAARSFLQALDVTGMLRAWAPLVPVDRLHVVTVPPTEHPDRLWPRFAAALGLDPALFLQRPDRDNASFDFGSSELLRLVNRGLGRVGIAEYRAVVKRHLALAVLAPRRQHGARAQLDERTRRFAVAWNQRVRDAVDATGATVAGDLEDLPVEPSHHAPPYRPTPEQSEVLDAAEVAAEAMTALVRRYARRLRRAGDGVPRPPRQPASPPASPRRWAAAADPVGAAATEIADLCRTAIEHRRRLHGLHGLHRLHGTVPRTDHD